MTPIVATDGAFVEWSVVLDARKDAIAHRREHQLHEFGKSLDRLERVLAAAGDAATVDYASAT